MKFKYSITFLLYSFMLSFASAASPSTAQNVNRISASGPVGFIENKGQFLDQNKNPRTDLQYMFERKGIKVQLMQNRISFELYSIRDNNSFDEATGNSRYAALDPEDRLCSGFRYESSRVDV